MKWGGGGKTHVELTDALALNATELTPEQHTTALAADSDDPIAQCDLAIYLIQWQRPAMARDWFTKSARAGYPDAMQWLGQDLLLGELGPRDETNGLFWLSQAAAHGSPLGQTLIAALHSPAGQQARRTADTAALKTLLDDAARSLLLTALESSADQADDNPISTTDQP